MSTSPDRSARKIGAFEWLLIVYVAVGLVLAGVCLTFDGEARFGAFSAYGLYAVPLFYILSASGAGEELFAGWPAAIYWTAALVVVNGLAIYVLAKLITLIWRRSRKPHLADAAR